MPRTMVAAWKIGMKRIMSIGGIGNWPRYIFLAVQSLLLLVGVIVACFVFPFESRVVEILHVTALSTALVVNISERLLFLCLRRVSRDNCVAWNFCADITRVLATEFFIFVALMAALYDAFSFYEGANSVESAVVILLTGFVGFLTSVVMKTYMAIKFTYSLHIMARRVTNRSNAATSRKCLLFWICIITCLESALQVLLVIVIILLMSDNELAFYGLVLMFSGSFLPVFSWGLCLWNSSPWLRFLPLSVAIDFPPAPDYPEEINVSHHFHQMYRYSKTCSGVMVNFLRLLTSPFFAILHVLFLVTCVVTFFYISVVWYVSLYDYLLLVPLFSLGVIILQVFLGLPSLIFGLVIVLLIPISPCLYPLLCFVFNVYIHKPWTS